MHADGSKQVCNDPLVRRGAEILGPLGTEVYRLGDEGM